MGTNKLPWRYLHLQRIRNAIFSPLHSSTSSPDREREQCRKFWDPGHRLLRSIRAYQKWKSQGFPLSLAERLLGLAAPLFKRPVTGADIPINTRIGYGLLIPHPNGIVIHPEATIGSNCLIFQQVTIGVGGPRPGVPTIGKHVDIGAGAKLLGGIIVGDDAKIGANAVVLDDIPAGSTAVGVPTRIVNG